MKCPKCGVNISVWDERPGGREAGYCSCNVYGPVVERPRVSPESVMIPGIGTELTRVMERLGYRTAGDICQESDAALEALPGLGVARVDKIREWCNDNGYSAMNSETTDGGE